MVFCFLFILLFQIPNGISRTKQLINLGECNDDGLYKFLPTLPKDTLIAGHPYDMDCIPFATRRKVYLFYEIAHPFYTTYYSIIKNRTIKLFNAYYGKSIQQIKEFCKEEKIEYIVFDEYRFSEKYLKGNKLYTKPFDKLILNITNSKNFAYYNIPEKNIVYKDQDHKVVKCNLLP